MDETDPSRPRIFGLRFGQHGDVGKWTGIFALPARRQIRQVQILLRAHTPIEHHRPRQLDVVMERVQDDALDRRETGTARHENDRLVGFFA